MSLTVSNLKTEYTGQHKVVRGQLVFDSSYPTGGEALTAGLLGLDQITDFEVKGSEAGYLYEPVLSTGGGTVTLKVYTGGTAGFTPAGTLSSVSGGTPAGTNGTSAVTGTGTGDVTPLGTNAASISNPNFIADPNMVVKPVITLTHAADPTGGAVDTPLYVVEAFAGAASNVCMLQSTNAGGVSVLGETADGTIAGANASARFWVRHSAAPTGVQVYVNEGSGDRLEAVFPSATDGYIVMPFENPVAGAGSFGLACAVKVYHSASAATGKPVYFNDNGAADAQLVFTDAGAAGGVVPAADITVVAAGLGYNSATGGGVAAAQTFTGSSSVVTVSSLTATAAAQVFTGSALAGHAHTFTGTAVSSSVASEVGNGTNLSALSAVEFEAVGY